MVKKALICLGDGFDELQAIAPIAMLRKLDCELLIATLGENRHVPIIGAERTRIMPDLSIESCHNEKWDAILLVAGELNVRECCKVLSNHFKFEIFDIIYTFMYYDK